MSDPGEENFSLSSFDLSPSFKLCASDEDDDGDTYIEFELQPATVSPSKLQLSSYGYDKEFEFRILVPTFVPFPGFHPSPNFNHGTSLFSSKLASISDGGGEFAKGPPIPPMTDGYSESIMRRAFGNCTSPLLGIFFRNVRSKRSFPKPIEDGDDDYCINNCNNLELVRSRKASTKIISSGNKGAMDLLRSVIISMQMKSTQQSGNKSCPIDRQSLKISNLMNPIDKWFTKWRRHDLQRMMINRSNGGRPTENSTTVPQVLSEDSKIVDVMRELFVSTGRRSNEEDRRIGKSRSRPTFIKSSPAHDPADSSVRAAIAHCKKSLGQPDDFNF